MWLSNNHLWHIQGLVPVIYCIGHFTVHYNRGQCIVYTHVNLYNWHFAYNQLVYNNLWFNISKNTLTIFKFKIEKNDLKLKLIFVKLYKYSIFNVIYYTFQLITYLFLNIMKISCI